MVTQTEVDQITAVLQGKKTADKAKMEVIRIASRSQGTPRSSPSSPSNVLVSQPVSAPVAPLPDPIATSPTTPYREKGWSNVAKSFELIGRNIGNVFVPGRPYTEEYKSEDLTTSQKFTSFLTNPAFVFGAPAVVAAVPLLAGGGSAAAATTGTAAAGSTAASASLFGGWKGAALLLGAGGLAASLLGGGGSARTAPQSATQTPTQNIFPSQTTVTNQYDYSYRPTDQSQLFVIRDSPGASLYGSQQAFPTGQSQEVIPSQSAEADQDTSSDQAQTAGTGISPILLIGAAALFLLSRD